MTRPTQIVSKTTAFPDRAFIKLRFSQRIHITAAGSRAIWVGNQPSDPTNAGSATNPAVNWGYWAQMYSRYMSNASSIKVTVVAANNIPCQVTLWPSSDATTVTPDEAAAQPYAKRKLTGFSTGMGVISMKHYIGTRKMLGYPYMDVTDLANSSPGGPPNQLWYWNVQLNPLDGVTALDHWIQVDVLYYVEWFDRQTAFQAP